MFTRAHTHTHMNKRYCVHIRLLLLFFRLIALIISAKVESNSMRGAQEIKKKILSLENIEVLGPVDSPIFKVKKNYRTRLLLKSKNDILIQKKLALVLKGLKISKKIKLTVDVDPINFT